jgi:rhamnosyltransferase
MIWQSVCAVIVTYNPSPTILENVDAVEAQVGHVVVIDNGSSGEAKLCLLAIAARPCCSVIRNDLNLGIAVALNLGVKHAIGAGFDWVVTLDQDSRVSDGFISKMLETYQQALRPERLAIISPSYVDRESGAPGRLMRAESRGILTTMTSGSMMPVNAINKVGPFDESFFMDYVDIEFCLRARRKGMLILQSPAVLFHSLGRTTYHRLFGLSFGATNHSTARRYYITRNRLRLLMRYAADWPWTWRECRAMLFETIKIMLAEDNKWGKFHAMAAGTVDALAGKVGKQVEL